MKPVRHPLPVTASIRDIGTRKDAQEPLPQMEGGYRDLLEAASSSLARRVQPALFAQRDARPRRNDPHVARPGQ